jgi:hypothetical protein
MSCVLLQPPQLIPLEHHLSELDKVTCTAEGLLVTTRSPNILHWATGSLIVGGASWG